MIGRVALFTLVLAVFGFSHQALAATPSGFTIVEPPVSAAEAQLAAVDAASHSAVWAVGSRTVNGQTHPFVERYGGSSWNTVALPSIGVGGLTDVEVFSPSNVWTTGWINSTTDTTKPLLLHWDGTKWSRVAAPAMSRGLWQISGRSSTSLYLLGGLYQSDPGSCGADRLWYWNGASWSGKATYYGECEDGPEYGSMKAIPSGPLLLPGGYFNHEYGDEFPYLDCYGTPCPPQPTWPSLLIDDGPLGFIGGADGRGPADMWIGGRTDDWGYGQGDLVVQHWNGSYWKTFQTAEYQTAHHITAVAEKSSSVVWFAGYRVNDAHQTRTLILRYTNSGGLVDLGGPNATGDNYLSAIASVPGTTSEIWAVGSSSAGQLLLHHY